MADQEGRFKQEGWRVRKDGTRFCTSVVIDPIRDVSTGKLIGFAKVTRDMTKRKLAWETLLRSTAAQSRSQSLIGPVRLANSCQNSQIGASLFS